MKNKLTQLLCLLITAATLAACKKTIGLDPLPANKITEFKVAVSDGNIFGAIDETDKTITLYLPYYYELDVIEPAIKLSAGAKLSETLAPVDVLNTQKTYTVIGADQSTSTYKLIIKLNQISPLVLTELSIAAATYTIAIGTYDIRVQGNFNVSDLKKIKAFLVDKNDKEYELTPSLSLGTPGVSVAMIGGVKTYTYGYLQVPQTLDAGTYKVRVKVQALTAEMKYPVKVVYGRPGINYGPVTVKQGETFKIVTGGIVFNDFNEFYIMVNGQKTLLPIVSYNRTEATIHVPDTVPPGVYTPTAAFGTWPLLTLNWAVTVIAK
ncbi:hypothetical protein [Pedobacter alluvionis]|uniref:Uncharacterized protein n=1 Tax=Pedobacter alluvionis TaxID=475253 RepID=A0A497Y4Q8_9SPHI|nr:hypothetical protein [Pedobacter alluvionis]RLJ75058.1 hypothetical protein BCL90_3405 [Pedobacter alluvionis]TFB30168.1 hypothetical protein E3V97_18530 [Pedobacter alluvionis]